MHITIFISTSILSVYGKTEVVSKPEYAQLFVCLSGSELQVYRSKSVQCVSLLIKLC